MSKVLGSLVGAALLLIALVFVAAAIIMVAWNVLAPAFALPTIDFLNAIGATVLLLTIRPLLGLGAQPKQSALMVAPPTIMGDPQKILEALNEAAKTPKTKVE